MTSIVFRNRKPESATITPIPGAGESPSPGYTATAEDGTTATGHTREEAADNLTARLSGKD